MRLFRSKRLDAGETAVQEQTVLPPPSPPLSPGTQHYQTVTAVPAVILEDDSPKEMKRREYLLVAHIYLLFYIFWRINIFLKNNIK